MFCQTGFVLACVLAHDLKKDYHSKYASEIKLNLHCYFSTELCFYVEEK